MTSIVVRLAVSDLFLAACNPANPTPTSYKTAPPLPVTQTLECREELIPPNITEVNPTDGTPGKELEVIGSGGYIRDTCGGYNESARTFQLYLDYEPVGELLCYVSRCQGRFTLASEVLPGTHCLSIQKDKCEFEFQALTR